MMIVDAHEDIAYNAWAKGRDFFLSAHEKRAREIAEGQPADRDLCLVGLPDLLRGGVGLVIASIYVEPARPGGLAEAARIPSARAGFSYATPEEAQAQALLQLDYYRRITADPRLRLIETAEDLDSLDCAGTSSPSPPVGIIMDMEGAEAILSPDEVADWQQRGVRMIGLTWATANRYAGGNHEPGPLTDDGRLLLREMERARLILDTSHLAEESFFQALDAFGGPVVASHANARALVPDQRHLSDAMMRAIVERDGVIGVVPFNKFLKADWTQEQGKEAVTLKDVVRHVDHICQVAGDASHVGLGSDFDGGIGMEATPAGIDTVADLRLIGPALAAAGYPPAAVDNVLGGNWLRFLRRNLPRSS